MKKKGLIISTVVMVVVLIASLTTATYAWFSSTAAARISSLDIKTTASEGLRIASVKAGGSGNDTYYSGTMNLDGDNVWVGSASTYGESLDFSAAALASTYGCSGDGKYLVTAANEDGVANATGAIDSKGKPVQVINASKNVHYFELDFAVQITESVTRGATLKLSSLNVIANGAMGAASRIALYTSKAEGTEGQPGYAAQGKTSTAGLAADKLTNVLMAEPFANSKYSNGAWATTGSVVAPKVYDKAEAAAIAYDAANVSTDITKDPYNYIAGSAFYKATEGGDTETFTGIETNVLGEFTADANDAIYLRLVIWFEGEDAECISAWAGTGITVNMEFGYDQKPETTP